MPNVSCGITCAKEGALNLLYNGRCSKRKTLKLPKYFPQVINIPRTVAANNPQRKGVFVITKPNMPKRKINTPRYAGPAENILPNHQQLVKQDAAQY